MTTSQKSSLSGSWVVNEVDDGDISWAEDSDGSQDQQHPIRSTKPQNRNNNQQRAKRTSYGTHSTGSDFIMPSIGSLPSPKSSRDQKANRQPPQPRRESLATKAPSSRVPSSRPKPVQSSRTQRVESSPSFVAQTFEYIFDILISALRKLKPAISWVLAAYLFAGGLVLLRNLVTSSISNALSPVCRIPGVSLLHLPICSYISQTSDYPTIQSALDQGNQVDPEFDTLMTIQSKFDTLLSDSSTSLSLPLDMKRSETSIRDLRQVVRFSTIPSKNELLHEFDGFIETARIASYDLQKFNSHVGRSVDNVLSTARWTQRVLDDISTERSSRGLLPSFIQDKILAPFQPLHFTEARLLDQYIQHSRIVSEEIERLIEEATGLLLVLANLEDRLDVIHGISLRDNLAASSDRDEILSQLWTHLGGNRAKLGKVSSQLALLDRVSEYRKLAYAHVSGTVVKLQGMGAELEELRERVGGAEVLRDRGVGGVPLSVHLEAIRLGVERLEGQREEAREVERGWTRRVVDAGGKNGEEKRLLVDA